MLFKCEVVVWMLLTYCNYEFSVSSNFIEISACCNCLLVFGSLYQVFELKIGVMLSFLLLFSKL